jgi:hypothetical protein
LYSGKAGNEDLNLFGRWGGHLLKEIKRGLVLALQRPPKKKYTCKTTITPIAFSFVSLKIIRGLPNFQLGFGF